VGEPKTPSRHYPHAKEGTDILTIPSFYPQSYPHSHIFLSTDSVSYVDKYVDGTIFINNMSEDQPIYDRQDESSKLTDHNIRLIVRKYFTPQVDESSNGIVLKFVPNRGNSLPEALVWFHKGKKGFTNKPISQNTWVMVDCDLKPLHEILHKYFHLSEGDYNITRSTLSTMAYELINDHFKPMSKIQ